MKNKTLVIFILAAFLIGTFFVAADSDMDFSAAMSIIQQKIPCSQLSQSQLIEVGDYYMQLALGTAHDQMDAMMGGDNATMDQQMHLALAERYYCNGIYPDQINSSSGWGYGMMSAYANGGSSGNYYESMMGNYYSDYGSNMMYYCNYQRPFSYYLPWILLALVVGAGVAIAAVLINKRSFVRRRR